MGTLAAVLRPVPVPTTDRLRRDPVAQAFLVMRIAFTVAPINGHTGDALQRLGQVGIRELANVFRRNRIDYTY